jgi:AcrR family transcriptional regulator
MLPKSCETLDPRIRRTRQLLHHGLQKLLEKKEFEEISVQDIAEAATVNRATFYDHYPDKFALLDCMVGVEFNEILLDRQVRFDQTCSSALKAIVLAVCDYLARHCKSHAQPYMEAAIIAAIRRILLDGLKSHPLPEPASPEMIAAAASWAVYGAAKEWAQTPDRCPSETIAGTVAAIVFPILNSPARNAP